VEYALDDGKLMRRVWSVLDRVQDSQSSRLRLIEGIENIEIRFLGNDTTEWANSWSQTQSAGANSVPRAIEVKLTTQISGEITRLFVVGS